MWWKRDRNWEASIISYEPLCCFFNGQLVFAIAKQLHEMIIQRLIQLPTACSVFSSSRLDVIERRVDAIHVLARYICKPRLP
jgi:hypothetical protein